MVIVNIVATEQGLVTRVRGLQPGVQSTEYPFSLSVSAEGASCPRAVTQPRDEERDAKKRTGGKKESAIGHVGCIHHCYPQNHTPNGRINKEVCIYIYVHTHNIHVHKQTIISNNVYIATSQSCSVLLGAVVRGQRALS